MIEVFVFILGTVVFSFGGVCISRIPEGKSVIGGRSECDSCGSVIKWYDMIPVLSFIMLRGKCRNCGSRIPVYCLVIELIGGVIGLLCYWLNGIGINFIISFLLKADQATNEQAVQKMISAMPYLLIVSAGILAPINEEILFRKVFKDNIKNK